MPGAPITRVACRVLGHDWEVTALRITHGKVECTRCGESEWRHN